MIGTLGIVGVGLLGGSLALAVKQRGVAGRVLGHDRLPGILYRAVERGLLDDFRPSLADLAREADLIVFCTPVDAIAGQVLEAAPHCRPGAVLTDVGSTKAGIMAALPAGVPFVGGHPLAGSEKCGPEHARGDLFDGRLVLLTPNAGTSPEAVERVSAFWRALGARVERIDAAEHDRALALTSHLPHLLASALAGVLPEAWARVTASGFRDTTRLASGSVELWKAIFLHNRGPLREALAVLRERLGEYDAALAAGDAAALERLLDDAKTIRDRLAR